MEQAQSIGELLSLARRRFPILVLVTSLGVLGSVVYALNKPPQYETSAKILVESQQIPDELARSTVNLSAAARLQLIEQRLMARDSLAAMIESLGLFADNPSLALATKVALIRAATRIESISASGQNQWSNDGGLVAFTITVTLSDAVQAAATVNELVERAIAQNLQVRADRARDTLAYFEQEGRRIAAALAATEAEISAFKKANEASLPEGLESRREALSPLQAAGLEIDRRILELEERQAELAAALAGDPTLLAGGATAVNVGETERRRLELELAQKRRLLAPAHPDLRRLEQQLAAVEALMLPAATGSDASDGGILGQRRAAVERQVTQIAAQIDQLRTQKRLLAEERQALEAAIRRTPEVEAALNALNRQLAELQERYSDVARRSSEARTGEQLEANQQSERFQVLEAALVPEHPVGPNRKKIVVFGSAAGVGLACGLVMLLEMLNPVLRTSAQLERQLGLRPVVSIPYVSLPGERWRRRRIWIGSLALVALGLWQAAPLIDKHVVSLERLGATVSQQLGLAPRPTASRS